MKRIAAFLAIALALSPAEAQLVGPVPVYAYLNITTDVTTVVKANPGVLHTVCVNTPVATETIQLYDNTAGSGTKMGLITEYASLPGCYLFDVRFFTGLTIVTGVAAGDITVSYQ